MKIWKDRRRGIRAIGRRLWEGILRRLLGAAPAMGALLGASTLSVLPGPTPVFAADEGEPCNARDLVMEAQQLMEANRPPMFALLRLERAQKCLTDDLSFEAYASYALVLLHVGRVADARAAATQAQEAAFGDEQTERIGFLQRALQETVSEVSFSIPNNRAAVPNIQLKGVVDALPTTTLLERAFPRQTAFARATYSAMLKAARDRVRKSQEAPLRVWLPAANYLLTNGQTFTAEPGATAVPVADTTRWGDSVAVAPTYQLILPFNLDRLAIGHNGAAGLTGTWIHPLSNRTNLDLQIGYLPLEVKEAGNEVLSSTSEGGCSAQTTSLSLQDGMAGVVASGCYPVMAVVAGLGLVWPVALPVSHLTLAPGFHLQGLLMDGVGGTANQGEPLLTNQVPTASGATDDAFDLTWVGGLALLEFRIHYQVAQVRNEKLDVALVLYGGAGLGTFVQRSVTTPKEATVIGNPIDLGLSTVGLQLGVGYRF